MRDKANRSNEAEVVTEVVDENWDMEETLSVNEVAASKVCDMVKEVQRICENGGIAVPTSFIDVIELLIEVVETKRKNVKLVNRINDLEKDSKDVRSVERLVCVKLEVASARVKALEAQVSDADAKYAKIVDETTHTKKDLRSRMSSLDSLEKRKKILL